MSRGARNRPGTVVSETLAYAFYHRPGPAVGRSEYEAALLAFHATLARTPTTGFRGSAVLRLPRVNWGIHRDRPLYVDWYVFSGFGDLGPVRVVAYRAPWVDAHRSAARLFGEGWGALYATRGRAEPPAPPDSVTWFSGPEGRGRPLLRRWLDRGPPTGVLWRRQLALGPSPEFCYFGPRAPPASLAPPSAVLGAEYLPVLRRRGTGPR